MPKETITKSSDGDLVRLKYTFRYGDKFDDQTMTAKMHRSYK
jgi:hypothetical protein